MDVLDYVEAINTQHEREREREWLARFYAEHPDERPSGQDPDKDVRWAGFIHRWAGAHPSGRAASTGEDLH